MRHLEKNSGTSLFFSILSYPISPPKAFLFGPQDFTRKESRSRVAPGVMMFDFQTIEIKHSVLSRLSILQSKRQGSFLHIPLFVADGHGLDPQPNWQTKRTDDIICCQPITLSAMGELVSEEKNKVVLA